MIICVMLGKTQQHDICDLFIRRDRTTLKGMRVHKLYNNKGLHSSEFRVLSQL